VSGNWVMPSLFMAGTRPATCDIGTRSSQGSKNCNPGVKTGGKRSREIETIQQETNGIFCGNEANKSSVFNRSLKRRWGNPGRLELAVIMKEHAPSVDTDQAQSWARLCAMS
jgi:hypothetical protein